MKAGVPFQGVRHFPPEASAPKILIVRAPIRTAEQSRRSRSHAEKIRGRAEIFPISSLGQTRNCHGRRPSRRSRIPARWREPEQEIQLRACVSMRSPPFWRLEHRDQTLSADPSWSCSGPVLFREGQLRTADPAASLSEPHLSGGTKGPYNCARRAALPGDKVTSSWPPVHVFWVL